MFDNKRNQICSINVFSWSLYSFKGKELLVVMLSSIFTLGEILTSREDTVLYGIFASPKSC